MTSATATYRKPVPLSGHGLAVRPVDRVFDDELRLLNQIVDEQGWDAARAAAVSHLTAADR
jgi:hypothetical protein